MLKVIEAYDFDTLYNNSWGQAVFVLNEIDEADMSEELMDFLETSIPMEQTRLNSMTCCLMIGNGSILRLACQAKLLNDLPMKKMQMLNNTKV